MKNLAHCLILVMVTAFQLQSQFVEFKDGSDKNRFLGLDIGTCNTKGSGSYKAYDCKNNSVSTKLNLNLLSPELLGQQFYIFNNFTYWMTGHSGMGAWNGRDDDMAKQQAKANADPENNFSGSGVFMINLGTSSYLQQMVAPGKTCPDGQTLIATQLKYNDGNSIVSWSQDSLCASPTDTFAIELSKTQDNSVPPGVPASDTDAQGINWMKDNGPAHNYSKADSSPRKIRLVLKSGGAPALPATLGGAQKISPPALAKSIVPGALTASQGDATAAPAA